MAVINVLCPGCKARFTVSEKFAGKKGPCPKCKTQITIPEKTEEIKLHAPENLGPKDTKGRATLQPIFREERKLSPAIAGGIAGAVVVVFALAWVLGANYPKASKSQFPVIVLALGAMLLAPPLAFGGYQVLRDDELEPFEGKPLWIRVGAASAAYVLIWAILWAIIAYWGAGDLTKQIWFIASAFAPMVLIGGGVAFAAFDLEYIKGVLHYGLYLLVTVMLRVVIGLDPLIGPFKD